ncbi:MAG: 50S ribosomal protein L9 [Clostridia bacterium]|nr:50S ribosomal protein L9 [Clostridia bacterium]
MKVVLIQDLKGKGKKGDIVEENSGYALNYLIPNKIAIAGTNSNINEANQAKLANEYHKEQERLAAVELGKKVDGVTVVCHVKSGETGKIFGSVTNKEVSTELLKLGYDIDKKKIEVPAIKTLGVYTCKLKLYQGVSANIKVDVQ